MQDPKKPLDPEPSAPAEAAPPRGGFGAFADIYRARWAASHPNMRPREYVDPTIGTGDTPASEPDPSRVHTEDGTRLFHPRDRS
jgi:hypothetical protein